MIRFGSPPIAFILASARAASSFEISIPCGTNGARQRIDARRKRVARHRQKSWPDRGGSSGFVTLLAYHRGQIDPDLTAEGAHPVRDLTTDPTDPHHPNVAAIIARLALPTAVLTARGHVEYANTRFAELFDPQAPGIEGFDFAALLDPDDHSALQNLVSETAEPETVPSDIPVRVPSFAGEIRSATLSRLIDQSGFWGFLCQVSDDDTASSSTLRYVMEHLDQGVWDYDARTNFFVVSDAWRRMRGLSPDDQINVPNDEWLQDVHPEDRERLREVFQGQARGTTKSIVVQYRRRHADGHWVWILCRASVMEVDARGRPIKIVGTDTEITNVKESEEALFRLTGKLQLAIEASGMGIFEHDPCTSLVHWDDRMLEIYGITDGQNTRSEDLWETYIHPDDYEKTVAYAEECQRRNADIKCDFRIVRPSGKIRHIRSLARSVSVPGAPSKLIGVNIDVTEDYLRAQELELARQKLEHDSRHDALTGLGNRRRLDEVTLALFNRVSPGDRYVVMNIDLDHFKRVNDTLGHPAGDHVLKTVSEILTRLLHDVGQPFRVGGDEFTVLIDKAPDEAQLSTLCEDLIRELSEPMEFEGHPCGIGASIGYAIGQGAPDNPSEVFINADTALYAAKRAGRSCYRAYSGEEDVDTGPVANVRLDLIEAMRAKRILCHYQPQFDATTLEVVGAEALVRWKCPERGLLTPDQFLPDAQQHGLMRKIDAYVFRHVADQQSDWAAQGLPFPRISLNVSKARLDADGLVPQMREVLQPHHSLAFELLETAFLDRPDTALGFKLDALRELGIRIELDDFGSGHSSIAALQALGPDGVKIDRSLVDPLITRPSQILTLQSLARIARLEGAGIVVEGLETGIQLAAVRDVDCDVLQGYALQRPMPAIEFATLIRRRSGHRSQSA